MKKEYAVLGYVDNDESRPNTEIFDFIEAEDDKEAVEKFNKYEPDCEDYLTGEKLEAVKSRLVELRHVKVSEDEVVI